MVAVFAGQMCYLSENRWESWPGRVTAHSLSRGAAEDFVFQVEEILIYAKCIADEKFKLSFEIFISPRANNISISEKKNVDTQSFKKKKG